MAQPKFSLLCLLFWLCVCSIAGGTKDQTCSEADETCTAEMQQNPCSDDDKDCGFWASAGECEKNPGYMSASCRKSCGLCSEAEKAHVIKKKLCSDDHEKCEDWAELSECEGTMTAATIGMSSFQSLCLHVFCSEPRLHAQKLPLELWSLCGSRVSDCETFY
jgi:hypothetical protein